MSPRALGASLALVAAILLAVALLFPAWWRGHPIVDGKERAIQEVHIGLFAAKGCNTDKCESVKVGVGSRALRIAEGGATGIAGLCAIMLAVAMWRTSDRRKMVAGLALLLGPLAAGGAVLVLMQGPDIVYTQRIEVPVGWGVLVFGGGILAMIAGAVVTLIAPPPPLLLKTSNPSFLATASSPGDVDALLRDLQDSPGAQVPLSPNRNIGGGSPLFEAAPQLKPLYELDGGGMPSPPQPDLPSRAPTPLPRERIAQLTGRPTPPPPTDAAPPPPPRAKTPTSKPAPPPPSAKKPPKPTIEAAVPPPPPNAVVAAAASTDDSNPITAVEVDAAAKAAAKAEAKRRETEGARVAAREETRRRDADAMRIADAKQREADERSKQDQAANDRRSKRLLTGENPDTDTDAQIGERRAEIVLPTGEQPVLPSDDISAPRVTPGDPTDEVSGPVRASTETDEPPAPPPVAAPAAAPPAAAPTPAAPPARQSQPKLPISTAPSTLPPPKAAPATTTGPTPACPQCEAPMAWVEEHLRFYCKACRMYF